MKKTHTFKAMAARGIFLLVALASGIANGSPPNAGGRMQPFHAVINATATPQFAGCSLTNDETGSGLAIHLGKITWTSHETGTVVPCPPSSSTANVDITGEFTIGAANGDEIQGEYHTQVTLDLTTGDVSILGRYTFHSGSGRFSNVSGSGIIAGNGSTVAGEAAGTMDGSINYSGN